jgi:hypothetical protein
VVSFANQGVWRDTGRAQTWVNVRPVDAAVSMSVDSAGYLLIVRAAEHSTWRYDIFNGRVTIG